MNSIDAEAKIAPDESEPMLRLVTDNDIEPLPESHTTLYVAPLPEESEVIIACSGVEEETKAALLTELRDHFGREVAIAFLENDGKLIDAVRELLEQGEGPNIITTKLIEHELLGEGEGGAPDPKFDRLFSCLNRDDLSEVDRLLGPIVWFVSKNEDETVH